MFVVKTDATAFSCPCFHRAVNVSEMSKKEEVPEKNLELREIQQDEASGILFADWNHPPPRQDSSQHPDYEPIFNKGIPN